MGHFYLQALSGTFWQNIKCDSPLHNRVSVCTVAGAAGHEVPHRVWEQTPKGCDLELFCLARAVEEPPFFWGGTVVGGEGRFGIRLTPLLLNSWVTLGGLLFLSEPLFSHM